jgi:hypothetical protein
METTTVVIDSMFETIYKIAEESGKEVSEFICNRATMLINNLRYEDKYEVLVKDLHGHQELAEILGDSDCTIKNVMEECAKSPGFYRQLITSLDFKEAMELDGKLSGAGISSYVREIGKPTVVYDASVKAIKNNTYPSKRCYSFSIFIGGFSYSDHIIAKLTRILVSIAKLSTESSFKIAKDAYNRDEFFKLVELDYYDDVLKLQQELTEMGISSRIDANFSNNEAAVRVKNLHTIKLFEGSDKVYNKIVEIIQIDRVFDELFVKEIVDKVLYDCGEFEDTWVKLLETSKANAELISSELRLLGIEVEATSNVVAMTESTISDKTYEESILKTRLSDYNNRVNMENANRRFCILVEDLHKFDSMAIADMLVVHVGMELQRAICVVGLAQSRCIKNAKCTIPLLYANRAEAFDLLLNLESIGVGVSIGYDDPNSNNIASISVIDMDLCKPNATETMQDGAAELIQVLQKFTLSDEESVRTILDSYTTHSSHEHCKGEWIVLTSGPRCIVEETVESLASIGVKFVAAHYDYHECIFNSKPYDKEDKYFVSASNLHQCNKVRLIRMLGKSSLLDPSIVEGVVDNARKSCRKDPDIKLKFVCLSYGEALETVYELSRLGVGASFKHYSCYAAIDQEIERKMIDGDDDEIYIKVRNLHQSKGFEENIISVVSNINPWLDAKDINKEVTFVMDLSKRSPGSWINLISVDNYEDAAEIVRGLSSLMIEADIG